MSATKGVILIGGPSKGTRMRPLTLDTPKPLLVIGGKPMIWHPLQALTQVPGLTEVLIVGFYEDALLAGFVKDARREFPNVQISYMREYRSLGTAGGLYHFRDALLPNLSMFFVINADICSSFPLQEMMGVHSKHRGVGTMLGVNVPKETATRYGCIVHDPATSQVMHYVEKPENWISSTINGGIYLFDKSFFDEVKLAMDDKQRRAAEDPLRDQDEQQDILRLEQDVIVPLAAARKLFVYETSDFWRQIKTASSAVPASALYLKRFQKTAPQLLYKGAQSQASTPSTAGSGAGPTIIQPVYIDPSAEIDPSAKIGPNVSLGASVKVAAGARVSNSIVYEGATIDKHACVINAIVGMNCKLGQWARVDGEEEPAESAENTKGKMTITILASDVTVSRETCVRSCIVLPNKTLSGHSWHNQVLL